MWQFIKNNIPTIKEIFQIIFFVVISIVTIITYKKAKRTLLQPIRTEVFKEQIKSFSELLNFFAGKGEHELRQEIAFDKLFDANCCELFDNYASFFFDIEFDIETRPYSKALCPMGIVQAEALKLADEYTVPTDNEKIEKPDPNKKGEIWGSRKQLVICLPREHIESMKRLETIKDSPLIPKKCLELIEDFELTVSQNIGILAEVLNEVAHELPLRYPNIDIMKKASLSWVSNKYNEKFICVEPKVKAITNYIREYYLSDDILE
jgi:hypothetical protein